MKNKIVAIIVTYNRKDLLKECIENILKQSKNVLDILVVDNHSQDGTCEMIQELFDLKNVRYCDTGKNLGGAGGFQYGIKLALLAGYEYLWIMDDDCIPSRNALEKLLEADARLDGSYGFLSSKVLWKDGTICKMNVQRRVLTQNMKEFDLELEQIAMASFVSLFVKADVIKEMGLPIKEFFIWTDDWEFTRRISRKYKSYYVGNSVVVHKSQKNISADISTDTRERLSRYKYMYRNDVVLYRREGWKGFCYEVVRLSGHILRVIIRARDCRLKRVQMIIQGTIEGIKFYPEIEYVNKE